MYTELKDFGYLMMWGVVIMSALTWVAYLIYSWIHDRGYQAGYWKGRKDGYDMHRRITDSKIDANNN